MFPSTYISGDIKVVEKQMQNDCFLQGQLLSV